MSLETDTDLRLQEYIESSSGVNQEFGVNWGNHEKHPSIGKNGNRPKCSVGTARYCHSGII